MDQEDFVRVVRVGQKFAIDLEGMPGAGYMWELTQNPGQIELMSQKVVSMSKEIGGNSTQRFLIVAHQPGNFSLEFGLKRKWEKNPVETRVFSIQVS